MDAEVNAQLSALRDELRAMATAHAELLREVQSLRAQEQARFAGENDPIEINRKLRALSVSVVGTADAGGGDPSGGGGGGGGGGSGGSLSSQVETIKSALCGASIEAECNDDGTITVTLDLPGLSCV